MSRTAAPGRVRPQLVLVICCLALLIVSIDNTIVNVALPDIASRLHASLQSLQWIVGAYILALGSLLLLAGSLADRFGRKRIFIVGLIVFVTASAGAGLATNEGLLIAMRAVQGVGGAMMTPVALAIISTVFPDPGARARAIGWWGAVSGIGIAVGPLLGGPLVDAFGWRSVFWANVPLGVTAVVLAVLFVPESRPARPRALDPVAQLLVVAVLGPIAFAVIRVPTDGVAVSTVGALVVGVASGVVLVLWERRRSEPLVDLAVFHDRLFSASLGAAFLSFFAFSGLLFANTMLVQSIRGLSATEAAIVTLPLAIAVIVAGPLSGRLVAAGRTGLAVAAAGWAIAEAGIVYAVADELPVWFVALPLALFGVGFGLLNDPVNVAAVSELPADRAGSGAAMMSSAKQVGQLFGVSVVGAAISLMAPQGSAAAGTPAAIVVCGALCIAGAGVLAASPLIGRRRLRRRRGTPPGTADRSRRNGSPTPTGYPTPADDDPARRRTPTR